MAWRFNASSAPGNPGGSSGVGSTNNLFASAVTHNNNNANRNPGMTSSFFTGAQNGVSGAGAFLRKNAPNFQHEENEVDDGGADDEHQQSDEDDFRPSTIRKEKNNNNNGNHSPSVSSTAGMPYSFGRPAAPTQSFGGAFLRVGSGLSSSSGTNAAAFARGASMKLWGKSADGQLPRKLFPHSGALHPYKETVHEDEDELDGLETGDREFVRSTKAFLADVDDELLAESFVPYERVMQIIATENSADSTVSEIDERLAPYYELQRELDTFLSWYIDLHKEDFTDAVSEFSEMVLAVSGSDEALARLKQHLAVAAVSLDSRAEQLQALRMRAAKSLMMAESLRALEASLSCEAEVQHLISSHHHFAAVRLLRQHKARLEAPGVVEIRSTQMLMEYVNNTLKTMHVTLLDDLMSCVFRQGRLDEVDGHLLDRMLADGASGIVPPKIDMRYGLNILFEDVMHSDHQRHQLDPRHCDGRDTAREQQSQVKIPRSSSLTGGGGVLAALLEHICDDPANDETVRNYLCFIPLCVRTAKELGHLDSCYEVFLSKATRSVDNSVAHFLRLYETWRRRAASAPSVVDSSDAATVRATELRARELATPITSAAEAAALIQREELRNMLNALFAELEKIVRNTDYLIRVVLVAYFPFLSECLSGGGPIDLECASGEWDVTLAPLRRPEELRDLVSEAFATVLCDVAAKTGAEESQEMTALKQLMAELDVDATIAESGARGPCLQTIVHALNTAAGALLRKFPDMNEERVLACRRKIGSQLTKLVRQAFRRDVMDLYEQWDIQVLETQLSYHIELIFHVLCDAEEVEEDTIDEVTLKPFLKQKDLVKRVHQTSELMNTTNTVDPFSSLDKMLSTYNSASGLPTVMEQTGRVSFSLLAAVKVAQRDLRRANGSQTRQFDESGVGLRGFSAILKQALALKKWFVFTPMNIITCYRCVSQFYDRCADRFPRFVTSPDSGLKNFFRHFMQTTYMPTLHVFHTQQLRNLFAEMSEADGFDNVDSVVGIQNRNSVTQSQSQSQAHQTNNSATSSLPPPVHHGGACLEGIKWPTSTVAGSYPILNCVQYIGQVLQKFAKIARALPDAFSETVVQSVAETLLTEVTMFLKQKLQRVTRGSLHYRILNSDFEDAFYDRPSARWSAMCDENSLWPAHDAVDADIFRYYNYVNAQRTSGYQYNQTCNFPHTLTAPLEKVRDSFDESIAAVPTSELLLKGDGVVVALALVCHSVEWLCGILLRTTVSSTTQKDEIDYATDCTVPGNAFIRKEEEWKKSNATQCADERISRSCRLDGQLRQMYTLSQACLFYLSLDARFTAFRFIPHLRDESYNLIATASSADTFVQAYNRHLTGFFSLLKLHLAANKIKYIGLTVAKPLSDLIILEIAHLRDKAISPAGLKRLKMDLLAMETALQLVLPMDEDVRCAVRHFFTRPATFLRYLPNRDVISDLVSSGDHALFSREEMAEIVRLTFRMDKGATEDSVARQIQMLYAKLDALVAERQSAPPHNSMPPRRSSSSKRVSSEVSRAVVKKPSSGSVLTSCSTVTAHATSAFNNKSVEEKGGNGEELNKKPVMQPVEHRVHHHAGHADPHAHVLTKPAVEQRAVSPALRPPVEVGVPMMPISKRPEHIKTVGYEEEKEEEDYSKRRNVPR